MAVMAMVFGGVLGAFAQNGSATNGQKVLYYTCAMHPSVRSDKPGACSICGMALEPVYGSDSTTNATNTTNSVAGKDKSKPYPLDTCLVDDMKLGSMGDPYVFVYKGQEIKFCCAGCKPIFLKNPDKYLKKLRDAKIPAKQ